MAFQAPQKIVDVLDAIHRREYVLPGIQREFVWKQEQIVTLFDSLLRGYPIGSFLFWHVQPENKGKYKFYEFIREFHERDNRRNPKASLTGDAAVTAILDGQQRLTSLYVGLKGSYSGRMRYGRRDSALSYPRQHLYLNLARESRETNLAFDFAFRSDQEPFIRENGDAWFRVSEVLAFRQPEDVFTFLIQQELTGGGQTFPLKALNGLYRAVMELGTISHYLEKDQDLDKVLNIFVRVNSGGTVLSYSDLLLSIAAAQWEDRDARAEIYGLVDELNDMGHGFAFSKDFVLKCCLMLANLDLRWKVENFTADNLDAIKQRWPEIAGAIRATVALLVSFGFSSATLASANAVIPIVYYLYRRGTPKHFAEAKAHAEDRRTIRRWLNVALLKGVFSGVPDNVLRPMRDVLKEEHPSFPADRLADAAREAGRSMRFEAQEIAELLDIKYGRPDAFAVLALLYPTLDYRNLFHQDHIHPRSRFTSARLRRDGIPEERHNAYLDRVDRLPNLQLLEGVPNMEKAAQPFELWLAKTYPNQMGRHAYAERHHIPEEDPSFANFEAFYDARKALMLDTLCPLLDLRGEDRPSVSDGTSTQAGVVGAD